MVFVIRFFRVVRVTHPLTSAAFGAAVGAAALILIMDVAPLSGALAPLMLLQALATSSGFAAPARRGHYDLLFATGQSRIRIGVVHWAVSALPGAASWMCVAALELAMRPGAAPMSLASGTVAGMFLVSTLPWAATVTLPRLTGGIAWILVFVIAVAVTPNAGLEATEAAGFIWPWVLVGRPLSASDTVPVGAAIAVASAAMFAALVWIGRAGVPLEAAQ